MITRGEVNLPVQLVLWNVNLLLGILESMQSMHLLPRGLGGDGGEKTAPPPETQHTPPPLLPKPPIATKPPVPTKPQVRIHTLHHHHHVCKCVHSACPEAVQAYCTSVFVCSWAGPALCVHS